MKTNHAETRASGRCSGVLLHPSSLPGPHGIGTLGAAAYRFIDFLVAARQSLWQVLPLGPTGYADSPYQSFSAFAGNPLLVSFDPLIEHGLLDAADLAHAPPLPDDRVDYARVSDFRCGVLRTAYEHFRERPDRPIRKRWEAFETAQSYWLPEYARFMALKERFRMQPWTDWPAAFAGRRDMDMRRFSREAREEIGFHAFVQFLFFEQWEKLRDYAHRHGIRIIGDLPLYVAHDSADCWAHRSDFLLDADGRPLLMAGVPPDYFSATGQLWGNPVYDWRYQTDTHFGWWVERVRHSVKMFDLLRVDHFRGLAAYWAVPFGERTAKNGKWYSAPGRLLLKTLERELGPLPLIAEDLGVITSDVESLRDEFHLPGMKILQFGFDSSEESDFLPHNYRRNCVVYTGTHDNDSVVGWYHAAKPADREFAREYLGADDGNDVAWSFIRAAWGSVADTAIVPLQDALGLDGEARMNLPGTLSGNWQWRYKEDMLTPALARKLARLTTLYGRQACDTK